MYDLTLEDKEILDFKKLFKFQSYRKYDIEQPQTYNYNITFSSIGQFQKVNNLLFENGYLVSQLRKCLSFSNVFYLTYNSRRQWQK